MMNKLIPSPKVLACAILMMALSVCVAGVARGVDPNASAQLKGPELRLAKRASIEGSALDTRKVVEHFVLAEGNLSSADSWSRVAAIQGDQAEMLNHARHLLHIGSVDACIEALAWTNKVRSAPASPLHKKRAEELRERLIGEKQTSACAKWYRQELR